MACSTGDDRDPLDGDHLRGSGDDGRLVLSFRPGPIFETVSAFGLKLVLPISIPILIPILICLVPILFCFTCMMALSFFQSRS